MKIDFHTADNGEEPAVIIFDVDLEIPIVVLPIYEDHPVGEVERLAELIMGTMVEKGVAVRDAGED